MTRANVREGILTCLDFLTSWRTLLLVCLVVLPWGQFVRMLLWIGGVVVLLALIQAIDRRVFGTSAPNAPDGSSPRDVPPPPAAPGSDRRLASARVLPWVGVLVLLLVLEPPIAHWIVATVPPPLIGVVIALLLWRLIPLALRGVDSPPPPTPPVDAFSPTVPVGR